MDNPRIAAYYFNNIVSEDEIRFQALFVAFRQVRSEFSVFRPFYAFDGTHTRSRYNLTLLIAVGIDGEDRIVPLAFALVLVENERWWDFFCHCFHLAFGDKLPDQYVVISDRDKGLLNAVELKLPKASHSMCCQHIVENIRKRFGNKYLASFWRIA